MLGTLVGDRYLDVLDIGIPALIVSVPAVLFFFLLVARRRSGLALCLLAVMTVFYLLSGAWLATIDQDGLIFWISIIITVVVVFVGLYIIAQSPTEQSQDKTPWPRTWARWILKFAGTLGLLILLLGVFNVLGLLLFGLFLGALFQSNKSVRYAQALEIVSTLNLCVRQNLPMAMALKTAAQYQKTSTAAVMQGIAHWLVQGYSLGEALKKGWSRAPKDLTAAVEAGEKIGQLPGTLQSLMTDLEEKTEDCRKERPMDLTYPLVVLVIVFLVLMGLCVFILPTFAEVMYDASEGKETLPVPTQILIELSRFLTSRKGLPAVLIVSLPFLLYWAAAIFYHTLRRRRMELRDRLLWHLPLRRTFERERCLRQLVQYLQAALRAGLDIREALREALTLDLNLCYKNRIRQWTERIEAGQPAGPAAAAAGMGRTINWAFSEPNQGNLSAVLKMIEETTEHTYTYRMNVLRSVCFPITIVLLGSVVGFVVLAFFLPMVKLITIYTIQAMLP